MHHWSHIRHQARLMRREALELTDGDASHEGLLKAASRAESLRLCGRPAGHPMLDGGEARLDLENGAIWYNQDAGPYLVLFYQAHELGHRRLHRGSFSCRREDIDPATGEYDPGLGASRAEAYSPHERLEREANVFARELLLPSEALRALFSREGLTASQIAERTGVPGGLVLHQLSQALLSCEVDEAAGAAEEFEVDKGLDPSQEEAAYARSGPVLVQAGPGTGKTRTLVGRIDFLLAEGPSPQAADPSRIVALTFSRRAAEEMRSRVARLRPEEAARLWMDTIHAFGLELLRKHGPWPKPEVVDPVTALGILEDLLPELPLRHFQNLAKPTEPLQLILDAICRAKDELCGPEAYRELAERMLGEATAAREQAQNGRDAEAAAKEVERAEKALEAASVYAIYQEHLERNGKYDFGDLIHKAVELLQQEELIRVKVQEQYEHVLVDEVQDINYASAVLLKLVVGGARGLWAVGDLRQAVYRFRGASSTGIRRFSDFYPDPRLLTLGRNYRSQSPIVDVFAALVPHMKASHAAPGDSPFEPWEPVRALTNGKVTMAIAGSPRAEGAGIAREVLRQKEEGVRLRDQAVLCRTHSQLAKISAMLEEAGVPTLYLGNFFEREEVRDLLSVVELACERGGRALFRVARFPEYNVSLADVQRLHELALERAVPFPAALGLAVEAEGLTEQGRRGLVLLAEHLVGAHPGTSPWGLLAGYLLNRSRYLAPMLQEQSAAAMQKRIAVLQLLLFARGYGQLLQSSGRRGDPKWELLQHVRRMTVSNDHRQLWQVPEWAAGVDAVRLLTVHASKGLEFKAVYVPMLGKGLFPFRWNGDRRPLPNGLLSSDPKDDHQEEEECLLFVACSRARDTLCLSKAAKGYEYRKGKPTNCNPPELLVAIAAVLPHPPGGPVTWPGDAKPLEEPPGVPVPHEMPTYEASALDTYLLCPRKYLYEHVLHASTLMARTPYVQFHGCVRSVLRWILDQRQSEAEVSAEAALARLGEVWSQHGPGDEPYGALYRREAERMVQAAVRRSERGRSERPTWNVTRSHGRIEVTPDHVEVRAGEDGPVTVVQRWRTGRVSGEELGRPLYALYSEAARAAYGDGSFKVEALSLMEGSAHEPEFNAEALQQYDAAIQGIQRGDFPATPDPYHCPHCPSYFACPAAGAK